MKRLECADARLFLAFVLFVAVCGNFYFLKAMLDDQEKAAQSHFLLHEAEVVPQAVAPNPEQHPVERIERSSQVAAFALYSSRLQVFLTVNGEKVYEKRHDPSSEQDRGIHLIVISQRDGRVVHSKVFDTYLPDAQDELIEALEHVHAGRIVALAIRDEGTFSLKEPGRAAIAKLGSQKVTELNWRDMWAMIAVAGHTKLIAEGRSKSPALDQWGDPVALQAEIELSVDHSCQWSPHHISSGRAEFCEQYDGYGDVCSCESPTSFPRPRSSLIHLEDVPVIVVASQQRPKYLMKALVGLLSAKGANVDMIRVYIDGTELPEAADVCRILGITAVAQTPHGIKNARISQHYKAALHAAFADFSSARHIIILEEDLLVAPDFFQYFAQTRHLLDLDKTLFCVSAWNDLGYDHSSNDDTMLYRVETMPGLGWLMARELFAELEPKWPGADKRWDWDMWLRSDPQRQGRECVIPDISRTFHFGASGVNMNSYFQNLYFKKHRLSNVENVDMRVGHMTQPAYDQHLERLVREATVVNTRGDPCSIEAVFEEQQTRTQLVYIQMQHEHDWDTWLHLAKCWRLWDLDARGFHKGVWRLFLRKSPVLVVGTKSPFASLVKTDADPIYVPKEKKK